MKKPLLLFIICFTTNIIISQTFNGGFESWDNDYTPTGWFGNTVPGSYQPVYKSTEAHSGNFALRGQVVSYNSFIAVAPVIYLGGSGTGITITEKVTSVSGYYQFIPQGGDVLTISILLYGPSGLVGGDAVNLSPTSTQYQQFNIPMVYVSEETPTNINIIITAADTSETGDEAHLNTYFLMDDITLSTITDVEVNANELPTNFGLKQNYPNPFNPSTVIEFDLTRESAVLLKIYDSIGREVASLINNESLNAGNHKLRFNAAGLTSGVYMCRLQTAEGISTMKILLTK